MGVINSGDSIVLTHFVMDFYSPELKLAIEVDGDSHYIEGIDLQDRERQIIIESYCGIG